MTTCLGTSALLVELLHSVRLGLQLCILGRLGTLVSGMHGGPASMTLTALLSRSSAGTRAVLVTLRRQPLVTVGHCPVALLRPCCAYLVAAVSPLMVYILSFGILEVKVRLTVLSLVYRLIIPVWHTLPSAV